MGQRDADEVTVKEVKPRLSGDLNVRKVGPVLQKEHPKEHGRVIGETPSSGWSNVAVLGLFLDEGKINLLLYLEEGLVGRECPGEDIFLEEVLLAIFLAYHNLASLWFF